MRFTQKIFISFILILTFNKVHSQGTNTPCASGVPAATLLTVSTTCTPVAGTTVGQTFQSNANNGGNPSCATPGAPDVWFMFTAPASGNVTIDLGAGTITDSGMSLYTGTCGSWTEVDCDDDGGTGLMSQITAGGLTPGQTYLIRVWAYGGTNTGTFTICVQDNSGGGGGAPANDNPCSATPLPVNATCSYTASTNSGATATTGVTAPGCASYSGGDVWFTVTVPASGNISFDSNTGVISDGGMAIYSGTCGSLTLLDCDDDNSSNGLMPQIDLFGQTPGATLWVRFWEYGNDNNGSFSICATEGPVTGPCGGVYNDDCSNPAILTAGAGSFTGNTSTTFTDDLPGNVNSIFCGSIENNSWFIFTASSTSEVFNFTNISNCTWGDGVQAEVYAFTTDGSGCCTSFSSVSNCYNPFSTTPGTVTASGLTVGNSYLLMVDGFAGDDCEFTISGWSSSGILPVEMTDLKGINISSGNLISWTTKSELNNSYFSIEKSLNGIDFEHLAVIQGAGNSSEDISYSFLDENTENLITYYRIYQTDFNGVKTFKGSVKVLKNQTEFSVYPNPTNGTLNIKGKSERYSEIQIIITDVSGKTVIEMYEFWDGSCSTNYFNTCDNGIYFLEIRDKNGNRLFLDKILKF